MGEIEDWRSVELPTAGSLWRYQARESVVQYKVLMVFISYPAAYAGFRTADKVGNLVGQAKVLRASQGAA